MADLLPAFFSFTIKEATHEREKMKACKSLPTLLPFVKVTFDISSLSSLTKSSGSVLFTSRPRPWYRYDNLCLPITRMLISAGVLNARQIF